MTARVPPAKPDPTPADREERMAQLRARRLERHRELALRAVLLGTGVVLLLVFAAWWLLGTVGGRDVLLAQIAARLPEGATFEWARAEGPASGPLVLHDVRLVLPRQEDPSCVPTPEASCAMGEIVFTAGRVMLDPHVMPLLGWRLRLERMEVADARLSLPEGDQPFRLPEYPDALPEIAPPLSLRVDALDIDGLVVERAGQTLLEIRDASGGFDARKGELTVSDLVVDSARGRFALEGTYAPGAHYRTDLVASAVSPGGEARLGLVARGDLDEMVVAVGGLAPGPVDLRLVLRGGESPDWRLLAEAARFDPAAFAPPGAAATLAPLAFDVEATGTGGRAKVAGEVAYGDFEVGILPSQLRLEEQVLALEPLRLALLDGTVVLQGTADFSTPRDARFAVDAVASDLRWGGGTAAPVVADARLEVEGTLEAWEVAGTAMLERNALEATVQLAGTGSREGVRLRTLEARTPAGALDASGRLVWAPRLGWELDAALAAFDPGYFLPGWEGAVNGVLRTRGAVDASGGLDATVVVEELGGQLRGRALAGEGRIAIEVPPAGAGVPQYEGAIALRVGDSRIQAEGRIGRDIAISAELAPLRLSDLLPDASGALRGTLQVRGPRTAPGITADLAGNDLQVAGITADSLSLQGTLPASGSGTLALRAQGAAIGGMPLQSLAAEARGSWSDLRVEATARSEAVGTVSLAANVARRAERWQGTLAALQLDPVRGAAWRLQSPAAFAWQPGRASLERACLASGIGGVLCAQADWPGRGATVTGEGLPLALVVPYLPERNDGRDWLLRGEVALDARVRPAGNGFVGTVQATSPSGGLKFSEQARRDVVSYEDLRLAAEFDAGGIAATLDASLFDGDPLSARLQAGWQASSSLDGALRFQTDQLTWMELLSPDIVEPEGRLVADIGLSGTRAAPVVQGQAALHDFGAELPALAIELGDGELVLDALADGTARIDGQVRTGPAGGPLTGTLRVDGSLGWRGGDVPLALHITGEDVLVSDTRDLHAVASPDVRVTLAPGEPLTVTGTVRVPEATLDLERLDRGVSPSPDVVVLDPIDPEEADSPLALALDLTLVLGEDVALSGFGLDGGLDGRLRVRQVPGREMVASGNLVASGTYSAYGQELEITRGRLSWSDDPVSDPALDLRAIRDLGNVTAGVDVRGRASAPRATVWSNPGTSQSEAIAYLALGRPLSTASEGERDRLGAASAALSAGGTLLASQLAASIGLDDAGVMQSRTLGGSVFGVGKYLSPRLYVGYGISLLGTGHVLTLKYLLDHGFDIVVESSSVEHRGTVNWRVER